MTLTAYTRRASYGDGDWKSRNCIKQPLSNYFRAVPENSKKVRNITLDSTCSSAQHPNLRPYTFELDLHGSTSKAQTPESKPLAVLAVGESHPKLPHTPSLHSFRKMCVLLWAGGRSRGGPFPKMWPPLNRVGAEFIGVTRKERPCFAAERGLDCLGHRSLRMVYWGHTKGTALFCCRMRPRPLWAHTSTRGSIF